MVITVLSMHANLLVPMLRLTCPGCVGHVEVPLYQGGGIADCPQCGTAVAIPEVIGLSPSASAGGEMPRNLKVRTPAMPGSRSDRGGGKEPPRLPKPGSPPADEESPSLPPPPSKAAPTSPRPPMITPVAGAEVPLPAVPPGPASVLTPAIIPAVALPTAEAPATFGAPAPVISGYAVPSGQGGPLPIPQDWRQRSTLRRQVMVFGPVIAATLFCSAAVAAWRVWPATFPFIQLPEPDNDLLYHYQPALPAPPAPGSPRSAAPQLFEEFAAEGFHFRAPSDYWERLANAASPFSLLQPAFTLRRSESSPPSELMFPSAAFS